MNIYIYINIYIYTMNVWILYDSINEYEKTWIRWIRDISFLIFISTGSENG